MMDAMMIKSALFVPADKPDFIAKAGRRGADAVILDLEDAVASAKKIVARQAIAPAVGELAVQGLVVMVRVNGAADMLAEDLAASVCEHVHALVVPKVESPEEIGALEAQLANLEQQRGLPEGHTRLLAFIESPLGLHNAFQIASASSRLMGLSLGTEDFSASLGAVPNRDTLYYPCQKIVFAARAAGIEPFGFAGSIADFEDMEAFSETIAQSRAMGFRGACCIHPKQVAVLNRGFAPGSEEIDEARAIVELFETAQAEGRGAVAHGSRMIDAPVYMRAKVLLRDVTFE